MWGPEVTTTADAGAEQDEPDDTTYIRDVTALCNVDGYAWLAIAEKPPVQGGVIRGPDSARTRG
jgi:hypothetical protein